MTMLKWLLSGFLTISLCTLAAFADSKQTPTTVSADTNASELFLSGQELEGIRILCVKRAWPTWSKKKDKDVLDHLGFPVNHVCHSSLSRDSYQNEIGIYDPATRSYKTLYKPDGNYFVGQVDLHWQADKFLFTESNSTNWKIFEMNIDGSGLRQVSQTPEDVSSFDACYLPGGGIVFASDAPKQGVPCWHGWRGRKDPKRYVANLYRMNADGSGMRRLCYDQDHDLHPFVRNDGQVMFSRWDYTGINRIYMRTIMTMNPDGTGQKSIYGSNRWFPSGFYYPQELPGQTGTFLGIVAGYHKSWQSGKLALLNLSDTDNAHAGTTQIHGPWEPLEPAVRDGWTHSSWPEFMTPSYITSRHYLTSAWESPANKKIGIYLADVDNNISLLHEEEGFAFLEPIPIQQRKVPPVIPEGVNLDKDDATVYIQDVYVGPGLKEVPRGTVKDLRVIAYDFGYSRLAGTDKIGLSGPWEAMRILGTAPVESDGSAMFKIPANTPVAFQPLDENGRAVQLMRSWVTAMPGETMSCVGCHESPETAPLSRRSIALLKEPEPLAEWYGPARGFDFEREVQPVLNRYCVSCHNDEQPLDLRAEKYFPEYTGRVPGTWDYLRLHPDLKAKYDNKVLYTPAYEALLPYIRRVNVGDDVSLLEPGEYHANTSELVQLLKEGHKGIELDPESWSRITTWIDMNGPCHGTWYDVYNEPVPEDDTNRRWELAALYGGPAVIPDLISEMDPYDETPVTFRYEETKPLERKPLKDLPKPTCKSLDLGNGVSIDLVNFGAGYWMGSREISNAQFRQFDPNHSSRYFGKRHDEESDGSGKGLPLDEDQQPAVRVSWNRAMAFCAWLSEQTGMNVSLPTAAQWEQACLAGGRGEFHYPGDDFSAYENMADRTFATYGHKGEDTFDHFQVAGDVDMIMSEGVDLADRTFDDGACVTAPIGSYAPNRFGLYDMHGNAAEWTRSAYDGQEKTVKGGSYLDRPERCSVSVSHGYPAWHNVYNVGFRIIVTERQ
ncbi:hypothetical protein PDESU_02506 [Pontiella desulfatans]|uniref:Uncharacterized protein n=1 Tax=Pontiella desulfatans TaxID=2750659 RepID=A0A6C2U2D1_PONDE|nr:SUMF1/EgtB/PvdO family nonheme iron enzyme [Pontiella desulfatans]VGO13949.1 hypothetical protein PDESU_02506 [Pontiella desulfatans]